MKVCTFVSNIIFINVRFRLFLLMLSFRLFSFGQHEWDSVQNFAFKYLSTNNVTPLPFDTLTGNWTILENETQTASIIFAPFVTTISFDRTLKQLNISAHSPVFTIKKNVQLAKTAFISVPCLIEPTEKELKNVLKDLKKLGGIHAFHFAPTRFSSKDDIISAAVFNLCDSLQYSAGNVQFILENHTLFNDSCSYMLAVKKGLENYTKTTPIFIGKPLDFKRLFQNQDKTIQQVTLEAFIKKAVQNWASQFTPKQQRKINKRLNRKRKIRPKKCACGACKALTVNATVAH